MDFARGGRNPMLAVPVDKATYPSQRSVGDFFFAICTEVSPFSPKGVPVPFQRRCPAHSPMEVMAKYPVQTANQLLGQKRSRYTDAPKWEL